jgi:hypothetical protein
MRALRIELRRSAGVWTGLLFLGLAFFLIYGFSGPWGKGAGAWTAEWTNLAKWLRYHLLMLWPLALAAGAWQGRRDRRAKMDELLTSTPRPALVRVLPPVAAMCLGLVGAYLVLFLIGAVQVAGNATFNDFGWVLILLAGFLSLIAAALLGMGIGRVLPFVLTAPVLGVAGLAAMIITGLGSPGTGSYLDGTVPQQISLLGPALLDGQDAFTTIATKVSVLQIVWFTALGLTGLALVTFVGWRARLFALLPVVAGAAVVLPLLPSRPADVVVRNAEAVALVCAPGTPRVCVSRLHEDQLDGLVGPARQVLAELAKLPGQQPTWVVESMRRAWSLGVPVSGDPDVVLAQLDGYEFMANSRRSMLAGPEKNCPEPDYLSDEVRRSIIASWFDGKLASVSTRRAMLPDVAARAEPLWQSLQALPLDQQAARIAELRAQAYRC